MAVVIKDKKLVIMAKSKTILFDLRKDVPKDLNHKSDFIIKPKPNELLAEHTIKTSLVDYFPTVLMNKENSKINEPHGFVPNFSQILDLASHILDSSKLICVLHVEMYKTTLQKQ